MGGLPQRASLFAQKCVGGVWFCFSASSKEQSRSCLQLQPLTNEVLNPSSNWSKLHTAFETNPIRLNSSRLLQSSYSFLRSTKTEAAAANQKQQQQQQPWSMGPRSSASKLPQILDPSPLVEAALPKEQIHKYNQVTIRHTMGTTQNMSYRSIQSMLRHPCGVQFCKGTRFRVDFTQAEST